MAHAKLLPVRHSPAFLPDSSKFFRQPPRPDRERPQTFHERFETRALVYDAFWQADGKRILLVGPAPLNLWPEMRRARFTALPSRTVLRVRFHKSLSVMISELVGAPAGTTEVVMSVAGEEFALAVQPNYSPALVGGKVLFSMSKDNDLAWIREWANYHARLQGADAVILFDNGSTRYAPAEIEAILATVPGLKTIAVPSWPYRFGATDPSVVANPYGSHFLQIASMSVVLRRFGASAAGLLNCDVDELVTTPVNTTIFDVTRAARLGLVVFDGQWIESVTSSEGSAITHRDFHSRRRDPSARLSAPRKWALDPTRRWVQRLAVHPYWHWIAGRPPFSKHWPDETFYWHFKGINTGWKESRKASAEPNEIEDDPRLLAALARLRQLEATDLVL